MLSAMIPFLHNVMAQAGLAQEPKEHILLHSLGADLAQSLLSLLCPEGWQVEMSTLCCILDLPHRKGEGQAEENACRSVPARKHKAELSMGDTNVTVPSSWDHWCPALSVYLSLATISCFFTTTQKQFLSSTKAFLRKQVRILLRHQTLN